MSLAPSRLTSKRTEPVDDRRLDLSEMPVPVGFVVLEVESRVAEELSGAVSCAGGIDTLYPPEIGR